MMRYLYLLWLTVGRGSAIGDEYVLKYFKLTASFSPDVTGYYVPMVVVTDILKQYDDGDPTEDVTNFFIIPY